MFNSHKTLGLFLIAGFIFSIFSCDAANHEQLSRTIQNTQQHFAPDSRTALFEVEAQSESGKTILKGETNLPEAKAALMDSLSQMNIEATDSIIVLPEKQLGEKTFGLVNNSVANLRSEPSHPAQLVTQATLGMPLKVLKKHGNWFYVQTPDDYLAWVDGGGLELLTRQQYDKWVSSDKLIYLKTYGAATEKPASSAAKVSDIVAGSILALDDSEGNYYKVHYPDGRSGYISHSEAKPYDSWKSSVEATQGSLVETAKTLLGSPYLWGGTSTKGMDCSGFTKTVYFMNGWVIPRDASQQVFAGKPIDTSNGFDNLRPGDLLFFGKPATENRPQRVVHVGMWIGDNQFIHSSGRVRVSSVDPQAENYDEYNLNRFLEAKRYLNNKKGNIRTVAQMYELDELQATAENSGN